MLAALLPTLTVLLTSAFAPAQDPSRPRLSCLLAAGYTILLGRYLSWRFLDTVLPAHEFSLHAVVVWTVFAVELLAWAEMSILVAVILRRTDRSAEADGHERRFATLPAERFPRVDVFIATYNEPLDVLEKTIAGALALDWPKDRLEIHVLDDGRRDWLASYCIERGVRHLTRDDGRHAKAGNINAALAKTDGEFILILDADFVPKSRMLVRAMGFFEDARVGIVQMPHYFFNGDPIQTSLGVQGDLPDEQRFFFDVIQPGRDGWNCAFCCGSNGIIRRAALDTIGGRLPVQSITEDMLLTLALIRKGFVTRYLNEQLAIGLAPENLQAYFIQRARWAQGAIQIMYLKTGPFGPGLSPMIRLLFTPSHWITQSICQPFAVAVPAFFLLTGIPPIINASVEDVLLYQLPAVAAGFAMMKHFAPGKFAALSATAQSILQAFRILPVVASTLVNPAGHVFRVTPKGAEARTGEVDLFTIRAAAALIAATGAGLILNADFNTRIVGDVQLLPVVAFWAVVNMIVLLVVIAMAIPRPTPRAEERFVLEEFCAIRTRDGRLAGETLDISVSGARIRLEPGEAPPPSRTWVGIELAGVGLVPATVRRVVPEREGQGATLGLAFRLSPGPRRDALIQKVFVHEAEPAAQVATGRLPVTLRMLMQIFRRDVGAVAPTSQPAVISEPPEWLLRPSASPGGRGGTPDSPEDDVSLAG